MRNNKKNQVFCLSVVSYTIFFLFFGGKDLSNYFACQATLAESNFPPNHHYGTGKKPLPQIDQSETRTCEFLIDYTFIHLSSQ